MEVLFHFAFQLVKISILASIYSFIFTTLISLYKKEDSETRKLNYKNRWYNYGFKISIFLFVFSFTYWGNHGLGDGPRIPLGYWKVMDNTNWDKYGYVSDLKSDCGKEIQTTKFKVEGKYLCGNYDSWFYKYNHKYFVYNMRKDNLKEFGNKEQYNKFALKNKLPKANELLSFEKNYRNYWLGWRFFFLP